MSMAVEKLSNTNQILKQVVINSRKDKIQRSEFIRFLQVDMQNCYPLDVTGQKYDKSQEKCLFLFIDDECRTIGILQGNEWDKKFAQYENYSIPRSYSVPKDRVVVKNRKHMAEKAAMVLMITPAMRNYQPHWPLRPVKPGKNDHKIALKKRLEEYKRNKYDLVTHEQVIEKAKQVLHYLSDLMFVNISSEQLRAKFYTVYSYSWPKASELMRGFSSTVEDYLREYDNLQKAQAHANANQWSLEYANNNMQQYKIAIINWYNVITKK